MPLLELRRVEGRRRYLYGVVDKTGQTIDFLLTEERDEQAAKRFPTKEICRHGVPEKITIDGSAATEAAIEIYNAEHSTAIVIREGSLQRGHACITGSTTGCGGW